ncbi:glutamine synthetase beta-grasp domain-containing protein [Adhaeretor mobilis]|uniref:Glutamine synthetase n=1 Tax=Adhaeretor mobilis TaxID=1930276 RepID=A0A517MRF9_9BACT|nr:glutamine synthetase beta-grasp domain-containing protein [Adhaeretor mobilis]QDS97473.1 Glutamine synthetase 2 [Adhaeretor mobilis]
MSYKLEYIWLDGYTPEANLRSKTKVVDSEPKSPDDCPGWSFDGSSTEQAEGSSSDCLLKPVKLIADPQRKNASLVLCEVLAADGSVHPSNIRGSFEDDPDLWLGFEQEYTIMKDGAPLGFPRDGYPGPQGPYYCSVGYKNCVGRDLVEEHLDACLDAGLSVTGINAEVMKGQWEYQLFGKGAKSACDDVWLSRFLLHRTAEKYGVVIELHPKPVKGDWNGSGMHCNFSTTDIREKGGEEFIKGICEKFRGRHDEHIASYGSENDQRLTGLHETQSIEKFSFGVSDRGASIRIPIGTVQNDWKGYLEDRRPASNADPYKVTSKILGALRS